MIVFAFLCVRVQNGASCSLLLVKDQFESLVAKHSASRRPAVEKQRITKGTGKQCPSRLSRTETKGARFLSVKLFALTTILVHVDRLKSLPSREDDGVVLIVRLPFPDEDGSRELHLVLLDDAPAPLVVTDEH